MKLMIQIHRTLQSLFALLLIVVMLGGPVTVTGQSLQSQQAKDKARVNQLAKQADDLAEKEKCTPDYITANCRDAFRIAAEAWHKYIDAYLRSNEDGGAYAIANFELGGLREKEGNDQEANRVYKICLKVSEDNRIYYEGRLLAEWVSARLRRVKRRLEPNDREEQIKERILTTGWCL